MQKQIRYTVEPADIEADGQHVRLITRYEGPYRNLRSPRHIETMTREQARKLRDDLDDLLEGPK
jgi:hypothetical protein